MGVRSRSSPLVSAVSSRCGALCPNRAKTCPGCGVKKPTATAAEANLDALAGGAFKLAFLIMVLVVVVIVIIGGRRRMLQR